MKSVQFSQHYNVYSIQMNIEVMWRNYKCLYDAAYIT